MMTLIDAKQAAAMLGLTSGDGQPCPDAAKAVLKAWGVQFVFLGPGRGRGFRWRLDLIEAAILRRESDPAAGKKRPKKRADPASVFDMPVKQALEKIRGRA